MRKTTSERGFKIAVTALWAALLAWHCWSMMHATLENSAPRLNLMFASGVALYLHRERLVLSWRWFAGAALALALSAIDQRLFGIVYAFVVPYLMLCLAYLPRGQVLAFNRLGDYSYGVYVYAYLVQQTLMHLAPNLGVGALFAASMAVTLVMAVLSWHFVEKPALRLARPVGRPSPLAPSAA